MITYENGPVRYINGAPQKAPDASGREKSMAAGILAAHNTSKTPGKLSIRFDALLTHDITYVGIILSAVSGGMESFPVPCALTNCHNSLCAVGGTINEDDHVFGLSAAKKFGGVFVPPFLSVIHQYAREEFARCGGMILGSDSHTRFGALGAMGVGEGGPELVRQLLKDTWDTPAPEVVLVYVTGAPRRGVGPHDVAISLCGALWDSGHARNKVLEFAGPGIAALPADYRMGIDVMTTETGCLSSIWETDSIIEEYYLQHGRPQDYKKLAPGEGACYDGVIYLNLSDIEPMAALPFHPSRAVTLRELRQNAGDILRETEKRIEAQFGPGRMHLTDKLEQGRLRLDQGVIAGCAGGMYDNIAEAAAILKGRGCADGYFALSVYPPSLPVQQELVNNGVFAALSAEGAVFKPCFCGPCFGAGDVPASGALSIRHTTRNFPNREGSRPSDGQASAVILMDARSIAATAANGGLLTSAEDIDYTAPEPVRRVYDRSAYERRVYQGFGRADKNETLRFGPNIRPWPDIPAMPETLRLRIASVITDPVTTTDELIPSGETSSYRSNPERLAEFALSRRDPGYVARAKAARDEGVPTAIYAVRPGDGSAREQAASCQRVLGGAANLCLEYATKRYRSNCINWGMLPFTVDEGFECAVGDELRAGNIRQLVCAGARDVPAVLTHEGGERAVTLHLPELTGEEREILLAGCLMNWYRDRKAKGDA